MRVNGSRHGLKAPMTLDPFHQPAQPIFHTMARRHQPAPAGTSVSYGNMSRTPIRDAPTRLPSAPFNPSIPRSRHSGPPNSSFPRSKACPVPRYGGGNPRTNIPRKNANRDTTTYVHTATPLRLSGESTPRTPIRRRNPEGCVRCQFSYLGVPVPAGMSDCYENRLQSRHSGESRSPVVGRGVARPPSYAKTPASHHFHSLMRSLQAHGDSGESRNPEGRQVWHARHSNVSTNQPLRGLPTGESCQIVDRSSMARKEECSAVEDYARRGARPPLGPGSGVAESAGPTRITRPQLRLFRPWCYDR